MRLPGQFKMRFTGHLNANTQLMTCLILTMPLRAGEMVHLKLNQLVYKPVDRSEDLR